tara:strand:+ start:663 stop:1007 length:345 start_codon:yes stop_codon:yes gene_type:complete
MCDKNCQSTSCPFAFTDESESIQNYGCLPTPYEIIGMRVFHNKTWACHSDPSKPCAGGLNFLKENDFDARIIDKDLVTETNLTKELVALTPEQWEHIHAQLSRVRQESVSAMDN